MRSADVQDGDVLVGDSCYRGEPATLLVLHIRPVKEAGIHGDMYEAWWIPLTGFIAYRYTFEVVGPWKMGEFISWERKEGLE
jgi:hypothetical protein